MEDKKWLIRHNMEVQIVVSAKTERSIMSKMDKVIKRANKELGIFFIPITDESLNTSIVDEDITNRTR